DAVGRTEAILAGPLTAAGARASRALAPITAGGAQPAGGSQTQLTVAADRVQVTATWNRHPGVIRSALHLGGGLTARNAAIRLPRTAGTAATLAFHPQARAARVPRATGTLYSGLGFDACSAPSSAQMTAWGASPYRAIGVYIGGTNRGCTQPN